MPNSKDLSKERYSQFAEGYVSSVTHAKGDELSRLVELAQPQADWKMLDIATGGGHTALKLAPHVAEVIASDLTPRMLIKARDFILAQGVKNIQFEVVDAEAMQFPDASFDLVTCRIAAHHFPNVAKFVEEAARVLKTGGILLVQDHVLPENSATAAVVDGFEKHRDPSHNRAFSHAEWKSMFEAAYLVVEQQEEIIKRHDFLDWAQRQGCTLATIQELIAMLENTESEVQAWLQPLAWGSAEASFVNHHLILLGRKA